MDYSKAEIAHFNQKCPGNYIFIRSCVIFAMILQRSYVFSGDVEEG
jgi:hypothetical protein